MKNIIISQCSLRVIVIILSFLLKVFNLDPQRNISVALREKCTTCSGSLSQPFFVEGWGLEKKCWKGPTRNLAGSSSEKWQNKRVWRDDWFQNPQIQVKLIWPLPMDHWYFSAENPGLQFRHHYHRDKSHGTEEHLSS